jgi:hypothetical protein
MAKRETLLMAKWPRSPGEPHDRDAPHLALHHPGIGLARPSIVPIVPDRRLASMAWPAWPAYRMGIEDKAAASSFQLRQLFNFARCRFPSASP